MLPFPFDIFLDLITVAHVKSETPISPFDGGPIQGEQKGKFSNILLGEPDINQ